MYSRRFRWSVIAAAAAFIVAIFGGLLQTRFFGWVALAFFVSLGTMFYNVRRLPSG
jgi:hypothetical protein